MRLSEIEDICAQGSLFADKESLVDCLYPFATNLYSCGPFLATVEARIQKTITEAEKQLKEPHNDLMELSGVTVSRQTDVMRLSCFDDYIDLEETLSIEKQLVVAAHMASISVDKAPLTLFAYKILAKPAISNFLVGGYLWERLDVFIADVEFSLKILQWFTDSLALFHIEKSPLLNASCIRFLTKLSSFPFFLTDTRIADLGLALISYFGEFCGNGSSEISEDYASLLCNLISLAPNSSIIEESRPIERGWNLLLNMSEFHFRVMFAVRMVPALLQFSQDRKLLIKGFQLLQKTVKHTGNTEVESISAAILFASFYLHCVPLRAESFTVLNLIAADHPSVETVEPIFSAFAKFYGCRGFSSLYLEAALSEFDIEQLDEFPYYLYVGADQSLEDFKRTFAENINTVLCRKKLYPTLFGGRTGLEKSFCKLYAEFLLSSDENHSFEVW